MNIKELSDQLNKLVKNGKGFNSILIYDPYSNEIGEIDNCEFDEGYADYLPHLIIETDEMMEYEEDNLKQ